MKKNIYFITSGDLMADNGASIIRRGQIHFLIKNGYNVIVVKSGTRKQIEINKGEITIPGISLSSFNYTLEALGIIYDKDIKWAKTVNKELKNVVTQEDILFVTTGGSMTPILAGYWLKKSTKAKLIINYHDPTSFTTLNDKLYTRSFHVNRDNIEREYIHEADYIITSSKSYLHSLLKKYPRIASKASCCYFGYIKSTEQINCAKFHDKKTLNIVYGGNMGQTQAPEILAAAVNELENVKAYFVGNYHQNSQLLSYQDSKNIELLDSMSLDSYYNFLIHNADVGFFSLRTYLTDYCVPSKLFDYINLALPMLAIVRGDAADIIHNNNFGLVAEDSVKSLKEQIIKMRDSDILTQNLHNLLAKRPLWSMDYLSKSICDIINKM